MADMEISSEAFARGEAAEAARDDARSARMARWRTYYFPVLRRDVLSFVAHHSEIVALKGADAIDCDVFDDAMCLLGEALSELNVGRVEEIRRALS